MQETISLRVRKYQLPAISLIPKALPNCPIERNSTLGGAQFKVACPRLLLLSPSGLSAGRPTETRRGGMPH